METIMNLSRFYFFIFPSLQYKYIDFDVFTLYLLFARAKNPWQNFTLFLVHVFPSTNNHK